MKTERKSNSPIYNMGFKRTSGDVNTLAHRASKLIITPVTNEQIAQWNKVVNKHVADKNEYGIKWCEDYYNDFLKD